MPTKSSSRKKVTAKRARQTRRVPANDGLIFTSKNNPWGKDQQMVLAASAGIIICIAVALFMTGWL